MISYLLVWNSSQHKLPWQYTLQEVNYRRSQAVDLNLIERAFKHASCSKCLTQHLKWLSNSFSYLLIFFFLIQVLKRIFNLKLVYVVVYRSKIARRHCKKNSRNFWVRWVKVLTLLQHVLSMDPKLGYTEDGHCVGKPHPNLPGPQRLQWTIPAEVENLLLYTIILY